LFATQRERNSQVGSVQLHGAPRSVRMTAGQLRVRPGVYGGAGRTQTGLVVSGVFNQIATSGPPHLCRGPLRTAASLEPVRLHLQGSQSYALSHFSRIFDASFALTPPYVVAGFRKSTSAGAGLLRDMA